MGEVSKTAEDFFRESFKPDLASQQNWNSDFKHFNTFDMIEFASKYASQQTEQITQSNNFMKGKLLELSKENEELHSVNAELRSLKQSILESPLKQHFPNKEGVSFHDKVVLAIHTLQKKHADLQQQTEQLREELADLNIQLSNYGYQIDIAKRERDKAENENAGLRKEMDYAAEWFGHKLNLAEKEIADLRQQLAEMEKCLHGFVDAYRTADELEEQLTKVPDPTAHAWDGIRQIIKAKRLLESSPKQELEQERDKYFLLLQSKTNECVDKLYPRIQELEAGNEELKAEVRDLKATLVLRALKD